MTGSGFPPPDPNDRQVWRDYGTCDGQRSGWRFRLPDLAPSGRPIRAPKRNPFNWCRTEEAALRMWAEDRSLA